MLDLEAPPATSRSAAFHEIRLRVPDAFQSQLVFRQEPVRPFPAAAPAGATFAYCRSARDFLPQFSRYRRTAGLAAALKALLKLMTARRSFYAMICEGEIFHYGWMTTGGCRHYHVERQAAVIGPIWTSEKARGRGLATAATFLAMNELFARGHQIFYIDTSTDNTACLKVIEKCGFQEPVGAFVRRDSIPER